MNPHPASDHPAILLPQESNYNLFIWGMNAWGYLDRTGAWAISPKFESASAFFEGVAVVSRARHVMFVRGTTKYGYLRRSGEYLVEPRFQDARPFRNGFAAV
jgi:hypothetical protein